MLFQFPQGRETWAKEFAKEYTQQVVDDKWVNEFSKLHVQDWADEFGQQLAKGAFGESTTDDWANAYDKYSYSISF